MEDFNNAYSAITGSESAYLVATARLQAAINAAPSRYTRVLDSLASYQRAAANIPFSILKDRADQLYHSLNDTLSTGEAAFLTSLTVSWKRQIAKCHILHYTTLITRFYSITFDYHDNSIENH